MVRYFRVSKEADFTPGHVKRVYAGDRRIAVFNDRGSLHAVDDACTHVGGPLSQGSCDRGIVTCPWHGAQFRLTDGCSLGPEPYRRLETYSVRLNDGVIEVEVDFGE